MRRPPQQKENDNVNEETTVQATEPGFNLTLDAMGDAPSGPVREATYGIQLADQFFYPAGLLRAVAMIPERGPNPQAPGRYLVVVKLHGDTDDTPRLRSAFTDRDEAIRDCEMLLDIICDIKLFAPKPAVQVAAPVVQRFVTNEDRWAGHSMNGSGWAEDTQSFAAAPPQAYPGQGFGTGPAAGYGARAVLPDHVRMGQAVGPHGGIVNIDRAAIMSAPENPTTAIYGQDGVRRTVVLEGLPPVLSGPAIYEQNIAMG